MLLSAVESSKLKHISLATCHMRMLESNSASVLPLFSLIDNAKVPQDSNITHRFFFKGKA
ncbi:hypothetical protein NC651_015602 [Populus alba x Populus x berolinensis]|nr:hypothetical protein NC651_015602 [Populus alba x Populus x berolinensis]